MKLPIMQYSIYTILISYLCTCQPTRSCFSPDSETGLQAKVLFHVQRQHCVRIHLPHERAEPQVLRTERLLIVHELNCGQFQRCLVISPCCAPAAEVNCASQLSQRGNGLQEHDSSLWLGQEADARKAGPAPAGDPNHHHLRLAVQRGQQLGEHNQITSATFSCGDHCKCLVQVTSTSKSLYHFYGTFVKQQI